jgi:hypothetical protein
MDIIMFQKPLVIQENRELLPITNLKEELNVKVLTLGISWILWVTYVIQNLELMTESIPNGAYPERGGTLL